MEKHYHLSKIHSCWVKKNKGQVKGYRVEVSVFWKVFRYSILFKEPPDPADAKDANCQNGNGKYEL